MYVVSLEAREEKNGQESVVSNLGPAPAQAQAPGPTHVRAALPRLAEVQLGAVLRGGRHRCLAGQ